MFHHPARIVIVVAALVLPTARAGAQQAPPPFAPGGSSLGDPYATGGACAPAPFTPPPMLAPPPFAAAPEAISERFWLRGEYLHWWNQGMRTPPLVTTSPDGTGQAQAGVLGEPDTSIRFGGGEINDDSANGFRTRGGFWFNPERTFGIGVDYFRLFEQDDGFFASSDGSPILARPFFDTLNDQETAQLIAFPGLVTGEIRINSATRFQSFGAHGRARLSPPPNLYESMGGTGERVDWLIGYRYVDLNDQLRITDELESLLPAAPGTIVARDRFRTENRFHGLDLGVVYEADWQRFWMESLIKVAIGENRQRVGISGSSDITEAGVTETFTGGTLAQRSNIGNYRRDEFAVVPELGVTLGARLGPRLSLTVGYSLVYFSNVVRAGDQIDTEINPNLFPPEADPFTGSLHPEFTFRDTDYWAHGLSFGGDLRF